MFKNFYVQNRQKFSYETVEGTEVLMYNKKLYVPINLHKKSITVVPPLLTPPWYDMVGTNSTANNGLAGNFS